MYVCIEGESNSAKKHANNNIQFLSAEASPVNLLLDLLQAQSTNRVHQVTHYFILLLWAPYCILKTKKTDSTPHQS